MIRALQVLLAIFLIGRGAYTMANAISNVRLWRAAGDSGFALLLTTALVGSSCQLAAGLLAITLRSWVVMLLCIGAAWTVRFIEIAVMARYARQAKETEYFSDPPHDP